MIVKMAISDHSPQDSTSSIFSNPQSGPKLIVRPRSSDLKRIASTLCSDRPCARRPEQRPACCIQVRNTTRMSQPATLFGETSSNNDNRRVPAQGMTSARCTKGARAPQSKGGREEIRSFKIGWEDCMLKRKGDRYVLSSQSLLEKRFKRCW